MSTWKTRLKGVLAQVPGLLGLARLTVETVRVCMKWRVTGLAAEAGFFALLSLPPLIFGLLGAVGYLGGWLGPDVVDQVTLALKNYASRFLTDEGLNEVLMPTIDDALSGGRPDVISAGFLLSLWSGSRCLNVLMDNISIMYGQGGVRGIVKTRVLSLSIYCVTVLFGAVLFPLIVLGPRLLEQLLPERVQFLVTFYWPFVGGLTILGLATLYYIAVPQRASWTRDLPGAALTLVIWLGASYVLRVVMGNSIGGTSIYGPLAAAIVVLIWLYFLGIGVLIGAAMNAASHSLWPPTVPAVEQRARDWVEGRVQRLRPESADEKEPSEGVAEEQSSKRRSGLDDPRPIG
ncbi:YihY/virulence factor BrkB family protein [Demetria terragena]|uniref:YihY/virulence factor BrkB family protein n=1 Tax=Demetria terragena TaxID=63959 RepID=UPI0003781FBB|nr:YihY/virulence factor BrkB family protein [Demetria terragena]